jgi:hypothetical protein
MSQVILELKDKTKPGLPVGKDGIYEGILKPTSDKNLFVFLSDGFKVILHKNKAEQLKELCNAAGDEGDEEYTIDDLKKLSKAKLQAEAKDLEGYAPNLNKDQLIELIIANSEEPEEEV